MQTGPPRSNSLLGASGGGQNSLLSQMAGGGNSEDEAMLREILGELGGSQLKGMGIIQLFQLTLEQLRKFKEDHRDLNKKMEEMKAAMDKDLSNPRTIEIIAHAQSDSESLYRPGSFYSAADNGNVAGGAGHHPGHTHHLSGAGGGLTPTHDKTPPSADFFGANPKATNYATAQP